MTDAARIMAVLTHGPLTVQALAELMDAPIADVRRAMLALAADGQVVGAGRGAAGLRWRRVFAGAASEAAEAAPAAEVSPIVEESIPPRVRGGQPAQPAGGVSAEPPLAPPGSTHPCDAAARSRSLLERGVDRPAPRAGRVFERRAGAQPPRLKPVSAAIARWARWFAAARWRLDEVADLFDVDPDALAAAVRTGGRR